MSKAPSRPKPQSHLKPRPETFDQALTKVTSNMKSHQKDGREFFVGTTIKRRHQALRDTEELVKARHDLAAISEGFITTSEMWVMLNLCLSGSPEIIERERHLSVGAALWILDHVEEEMNLPYNYVDLPDMFDPAHDTDIIRSTVYLLKNRETERKKYDKLLSQIPEEAVQTAVSNFQESFWAWIDHVYEFITPLVNKIGALVRRYNQAVDEFNEGLKEIDKIVPPEKKFNPLLANPMPSFTPPSPHSQLIREMNSPKMDASLAKLHSMEQLTDRMLEMRKEFDNLHHLLYSAIVIPIDLSFINSGIYEKAGQKSILPDEFNSFFPGDPYELCFAYFYLQGQDSDLLWLWGATIGLMNQVGKNLPWGLSDYGHYLPSGAKRPVTMPDLHHMQYFSDEQEYPVSLSQLVYNLGGGILPRKWSMYAGWSDYLRKVGVKDIKLAVAAISIFHSIRQKRAPSIYDEPVEQGLTSEDVAELQQEVKDLQGKLKRATGEIREQERRVQKLEQQLETEKEKYQADQEELASLREVLFVEEQENTGTPLPLPYTVKSRIVVYGGHDTWLKAMKEYVTGDIRFIDKDQGILDRSVIRNADTVWIQHNALSHRQYYAIIDEVRKYNKPVQYFLYASAKKCVEQIAKDEANI